MRDEKYTYMEHIRKKLKKEDLDFLGVEDKFELKWVLRNMVVMRLI